MTIRDPLGSGGDGALLPLVRAVREGARAAADRLYDAVRPRLLRVALALGTDPEAAADTVQDSLWAAHRNLHRFDAGRASFEGWLSVILLRRLSNRRRCAANRHAKAVGERVPSRLVSPWIGCCVGSHRVSVK
jgi:DNA-directed RNA polymerase specialized sigma24 family protein